MFVREMHQEKRLDVLHSLISSHPLGTWVSFCDAELNVNHIPFALDTSEGDFGTLWGHIARANPLWKSAKSETPDVIVFRGPQSYITPSWYPSKADHGKVVPTWNYAVVAAHGHPEFISDKTVLSEHLNRLTDQHEGSREIRWAMEDAPRSFTEKLVSGVVGVRLPIQRLEGKWKTNQSSSNADKVGVIAGLMERGDDDAVAMATLIKKHSVP